MVLKFYGYTHSTAAKIVAMVLREKQIPYEYIPIDLGTRENRASEYLALQPFGQVPTIDDDGFILYESRAIARYLVENYPGQGTELIPSDPKKRALFDQAASVEAFCFDHYVNPIILEGLLPKIRGQPYNEERIKQLADDLSKRLDVYDQILSKQKYIAGDELTLADLYHLPGGSLLPLVGINVIQEKPNVARWFNEISNLDSWKKVKDGLPGAN
ncbi:hypothetical protein D9756_008530 [Leucocoprinus leucothites]|uniref:glutathione transferase n=1 Tax=Leucocoprinus leucothites TaxID=201217 RepID=A0A8H5FVQ7_9AGAR|nr:hypothetical protein D9756_008530 [Leucoagaricus leucothites]